jgi:hypothetical protein
MGIAPRGDLSDRGPNPWEESDMRRTFTGCTICLAAIAGCNTPEKRLNAPPHGEPYETADSQGTLVYMADNAMLADMTMNDAHFVPHRASLNGLGMERLTRLAQLMQAHGGTIRLNTDECMEGLNTQRMQSIRDFISEAGITVAGDVVVCDMPGGEGLSAAENMLIRTNEGMYKPGQNKSSGGGASTSSNGGGDAPK